MQRLHSFILVVDDQPQWLEVMKYAFEASEFRVVTAVDIKSALLVMRSRENISVVITNCNLTPAPPIPRIWTGVTLLEEIRSGWPNVIRIASSNFGEHEPRSPENVAMLYERYRVDSVVFKERSELLGPELLERVRKLVNNSEYWRSFAMNGGFEFDAFICHSSVDIELVRQVLSRLTERGVRCWIDHEQIKFGDSVLESIERGIGLSRRVLLCLSTNSIGSRWCRHEYEPVVARVLGGDDRRRVVPLVLGDIDDKEIPDAIYPKRRAHYAKPEEFEELTRLLLSDTVP